MLSVGRNGDANVVMETEDVKYWGARKSHPLQLPLINTMPTTSELVGSPESTDDNVEDDEYAASHIPHLSVHLMRSLGGPNNANNLYPSISVSSPRSRQMALANLKASASSSSTSMTSHDVENLDSMIIPPPKLTRNVSPRSSSSSPRIYRGSSINATTRLGTGVASTVPTRRRSGLRRRSVRGFLLALLVLCTFFLVDWWIFSRLQDVPVRKVVKSDFPLWFKGEWSRFPKGGSHHGIMHDRLLALASHTLAEEDLKPEPKDLWIEPFKEASVWKPCADKQESHVTRNSTGYIMVSANGGLNQQRVAICNAVAVSRLLNATLVIPQFLYSSVWKDSSQFDDIYDGDYFIDYLKDEVVIVRELPAQLQSLDLEAMGSLVTDMEIMKEAKPSFYIRHILPILFRNRVVHFYGFGHRLAFDPIPMELQRLRCKCNFHALKFVPKIRETGALLIQRMKARSDNWGPLGEEDSPEHNAHLTQERNEAVNSTYLHMLVGSEYNEGDLGGKLEMGQNLSQRKAKYLGLHLRFEIDMVAYSMCEFGGGEEEQKELEAYRQIHFPTLTSYKNNGKLLSPTELRKLGKCPLTPEEAVLMLVALGFKRATRLYLAGAQIYGGHSRMVAFTTLYPNVVTKEDLLSPKELAPFKHSLSQMAALDFIGCAAADVFAMTDSGSQLSSLVSGYRIYYGGGRKPTIRPKKHRLASIFSKDDVIEWNEFRDRVRKAVKETKKVHIRSTARSIYRNPRSLECMCNSKA